MGRGMQEKCCTRHTWLWLCLRRRPTATSQQTIDPLWLSSFEESTSQTACSTSGHTYARLHARERAEAVCACNGLLVAFRQGGVAPARGCRPCTVPARYLSGASATSQHKGLRTSNVVGRQGGEPIHGLPSPVVLLRRAEGLLGSVPGLRVMVGYEGLVWRVQYVTGRGRLHTGATRRARYFFFGHAGGGGGGRRRRKAGGDGVRTSHSGSLCPAGS